jgi:hydrogenase small subunit
MWNSRTSWPIGAGHPCIGCTEVGFWDTMTPFYTRLPDVAGIGVEHTADVLGAAAAIGTAAGIGAHAIGTGLSRMRERRNLPQFPEGPSSGGAASGPTT